MRATAKPNTRSKSDRTDSTRRKRKTVHFDESSDQEDESNAAETSPNGSSSATQSTIEFRVPTNTNDSATTMDTSRPNDQDPSDAEVPKSAVWDYAVKLPDGQAKCLRCNRQVSCKGHSTTGLRRHLHRCLNSSLFAPTTGGTNSRGSKRLSMTDDAKRKFHELIYKCIVQDGRTFGDMRKPGMRRLLEGILPGG
jgi:hypothetical protein